MKVIFDATTVSASPFGIKTFDAQGKEQFTEDNRLTRFVFTRAVGAGDTGQASFRAQNINRTFAMAVPLDTPSATFRLDYKIGVLFNLGKQNASIPLTSMPRPVHKVRITPGINNFGTVHWVPGASSVDGIYGDSNTTLKGPNNTNAFGWNWPLSGDSLVIVAAY